MPKGRESVARKSRIVSFDDARRSTQSRASSSRRAARASSRDAGERSSSRSRRSTTRESSSLQLTSERIRRQQEGSGEERRADAESSSRSARASRQSRAAASRDSRQRERNKARADRMFDRQFAKETPAEGEGAPRAALYKGKMGSSHRKSTRMQDSAPSGFAAKTGLREGASGVLSNVSYSPRAMRVLTAVLCVVVAFVLLYDPARQCYQAQREHDRLAAEYSTIEQRNDVLDVQNDALVSDAGMEDAVREKYGYVKAGEETAVVSGLSDETVDTAHDSDAVEANVLSSSVKAPEEWYTPLLDAFFGVE